MPIMVLGKRGIEHEKHSAAGCCSGNSRNVYGKKTIISDHGKYETAVPYDGNGNFETSRLPSVSSVDSIDWDKPSPEKIKERVLSKAKSGSIVLFHNDLANTTEALPQILTELKSQGYEFVPVSELIFTEEYYIDADGTQKAIVQSSLPTEEELTEALALYSDELSAAGISEEQAAQAVSALSKGGADALPAELPDEAREVLASVISAARGAQTAQAQEPDAPATPLNEREEASSAK